MTSVRRLRQETCCTKVSVADTFNLQQVSDGCPWLCSKLRLMPRWKSMAHTTVTCFRLKSYGLQCVCHILCLPTMQCSCCWLPSVRDNQPSGTADTCVHFIIPLATQQHRSEQTWPQNMGRTAATDLPSSRRRWTNEVAQHLCWV